MDTPRRHSAQIYRFPPGGRAAPRRDAGPKTAPAIVTLPSGRGWYHDVAIRDAGKGKGPDPQA